MRPSRIARILLAVSMFALMANVASATTLVRRGLDRLANDNESIVQGKVVDLHSYWNADHSFILTDVRVRPSQTFKQRDTRVGDITLTVLGGTVGEVTTLIIGGPEFEPGSEYVLFLGTQDLPGRQAALSIRDLSQGVFEVVSVGGVRRAINQASRHPLVPDGDGVDLAPGGDHGYALDELLSRLQALTGDK